MAHWTAVIRRGVTTILARAREGMGRAMRITRRRESVAMATRIRIGALCLLGLFSAGVTAQQDDRWLHMPALDNDVGSRYYVDTYRTVRRGVIVDAWIKGDDKKTGVYCINHDLNNCQSFSYANISGACYSSSGKAIPSTIITELPRPIWDNAPPESFPENEIRQLCTMYPGENSAKPVQGVGDSSTGNTQPAETLPPQGQPQPQTFPQNVPVAPHAPHGLILIVMLALLCWGIYLQIRVVTRLGFKGGARVLWVILPALIPAIGWSIFAFIRWPAIDAPDAGAKIGNADTPNNPGVANQNSPSVADQNSHSIDQNSSTDAGVSWFRKAAEQGDADAQNVLGEMYYYGRGVAQDPPQAVFWFQKAAKQGNADAQNNLGMAYQNGQGVEQNSAEAGTWLRKAAEQGNAQAQNALGIAYWDGRGVDQDLVQASSWFRKAAEQGLADAQYNVGFLYETSYGATKDYAQAVFWYRKAAEQGLAIAQNSLGDMFYSGRGTAQDNTQAAFWYRKAAEQGNARAQFNLGHMYANGTGVEKDDTQAVFWYRKAAAQGNAEAQNALKSR